MRKLNCVLLVIFFLTINLIKAQEEKKSKFNIVAYGGIGYGIVKNDNEPNYNLNSNSAEVLFNYSINQRVGIATGISSNELSGNGFNSLGNFYHERTLLKIPLVATMNYNLSGKLKMIANFGLYGQTIVKDKYNFLNNTQKDIYDGWNFGAQMGLGFVFNAFENFSVGVNYNGQSDFSKFESSNNQGINDEQKIKNLNSVGVVFMIEI